MKPIAIGDCNACVYVIKTDSMGCIEPGCHLTGTSGTPPVADAGITVYPNPATDDVYVAFSADYTWKTTLSLVDITGRRILHRVLQPGEVAGQPIQLPVANWPKGMYLLHIQHQDGRAPFVSKLQIH